MTRSEKAWLTGLAQRPGLAWLACLLIALMLDAVTPAKAHDLPNEIVVRSFVQPEGDRLHVVTRVPLALLEGMALTKRGAGYLDLPRLGDGLERSAVAVASAFVTKTASGSRRTGPPGASRNPPRTRSAHSSRRARTCSGQRCPRMPTCSGIRVTTTFTCNIRRRRRTPTSPWRRRPRAWAAFSS